MSVLNHHVLIKLLHYSTFFCISCGLGAALMGDKIVDGTTKLSQDQSSCGTTSRAARAFFRSYYSIMTVLFIGSGGKTFLTVIVVRVSNIFVIGSQYEDFWIESLYWAVDTRSE
ncbi:uncharacterized protein EV154DRAFT_553409 [Mucor mucedo]|uniref:uncharacterized protein n=1 Tax=Mucor mucedo TaxID=29922 RepID=UPI00222090D7|nr:uncharacterized protein EV154DRAFT_553409 [Mucor mucedo]KAI7889029.1 hypothetical protein EV154DRAFT_553409 [Mucor mucedo]